MPAPAPAPGAPGRAIVAGPAGRDPDFVCVGTQRAGTTWLHAALDADPGYWMPPFKELGHFGPPEMLHGPEQRLVFLHAVLTREAAAPAPDLALLRWLRRFALAPRQDLAWYRSLFAPAGDRCTGDISPNYFVLDEAAVARMAAALPRARVLILLRAPLARALSQRRFMIERGLWEPTVSVEVQLHRLCAGTASQRARYAEVVDRYERHFPGRVGIFFHDHLAADPEAQLGRIAAFLGRPLARPTAPRPAPVNATRLSLPPLPPAALQTLAARYLDLLGDLPARFSDPVAGWAADLARTAQGAP